MSDILAVPRTDGVTFLLHARLVDTIMAKTPGSSVVFVNDPVTGTVVEVEVAVSCDALAAALRKPGPRSA